MASKRDRSAWDAERVRALRRHLGLSQVALSEELGIRQQTVSEWETGLYQPRGASARLLGMIAERAAFDYGVDVAPTDEADSGDAPSAGGDEPARASDPVSRCDEGP